MNVNDVEDIQVGIAQAQSGGAYVSRIPFYFLISFFYKYCHRHLSFSVFFQEFYLINIRDGSI